MTHLWIFIKSNSSSTNAIKLKEQSLQNQNKKLKMKEKKHTPSIYQIWFGIFLLSLIVSCSDNKNKITADTKIAPPPPLQAEVFIVKTKTISEKLELPGTIIANESTDLHPEISGRLIYLNISEGKTIAKGTLIAKIFDGDLVAQLNKLKVQLHVAEQTTSRYAELLKINGVSQQEFDLSQLQINNIKADMAIVKSNIQRTELRAPFSGTLGLKMVSSGAYITPATVVTSIRDNQQLKIEFNVPERYLEKIRIGQIIDFTTVGNNKKYQATIDASEFGVTAENRSLKIHANVVNGDKDLLPGAFVGISVRFDPDTTALMIPSQAVLPQARGKKVARLINGSVAFSNVETGMRDSAMVQIKTGLSVGDTIILTGLMGLKPDTKVNVSRINE